MSEKSFLLSIDGSAQSLYAAEIAWKLAEANQAKVLCQTVLDSGALWSVIGKETPGIIGSGPYMAVHEAVGNALRLVCEALLTAYDARAQAHKVVSDSVLDEGNLLHEVLERAKDHDLVVIGHRGASARSEGTDSYVTSGSVSKRLAMECPVPLLIIQNESRPWTKARLVASRYSLTQPAVDAFFGLTAPLGLKKEVFCLGSEATIAKFVRAVKRAVDKHGTVDVSSRKDDEVDEPWECAVDVHDDTLLVVTTEDTSVGRTTCGGTEIGEFIDSLQSPAILVLPPQDRTSRLVDDELVRVTVP